MASLPLSSSLFSSHHQTTKRLRFNPSAEANGRRPWWSPLFHSAFTGDQSRSECETAGDFMEEAKYDGSQPSISFSALTPEKARVLRKELRTTEIWHDAMYHSAIASRLASPDQA